MRRICARREWHGCVELYKGELAEQDIMVRVMGEDCQVSEWDRVIGQRSVGAAISQSSASPDLAIFERLCHQQILQQRV